jgi:hypothetical protein
MALASTPPLILCRLTERQYYELLQTCNAIKQFNNIMTALNQTFCFLQSDPQKLLRASLQARQMLMQSLSFYTTLHISHLFRTFVYQYYHEVTFRMFAAMEFSDIFRRTVLPTFGCATINPRWPLPIGVKRSTIRVA